MTWSEFKLLVLAQYSDLAPASGSDVLFVEAIAEFVRSRAVREILGESAVSTAKIHEAEYRKLRRKLAGRVSTLSASAMVTAVRARLREADATDATAVAVLADYVRGQIAKEVDNDSVLAEAYQRNYQSGRLRLLGHAFTQSSTATKAAVRVFLPEDADREAENDGFNAFVDAEIERGIAELAALKTWVQGLVTAGREELEAAKARFDVELINGCIELQEKVPGLQSGNTTTYTVDDVEVQGYACRALRPAQARPEKAWIVYPASEGDVEVDAEDLAEGVQAPVGCARVRCVQVPWQESQSALVCTNSCQPRISFERQGRCFLIAPALVADEIEFKLQWAGVRHDYDDADADEVPFDKVCAIAVARWIEAQLAIGDGDGPVAKLAMEQYIQVRRRIYVEDREQRNLAG